MLALTPAVYHQVVAHCLDGLPEEACGLLAGTAGGPAGGAGDTGDAQGTATATTCYPARNEEASASLYRLHGLDHLRAERDAEARGIAILGVFHSHTHTDAWPSPTDVARAPDPTWRYVIVSLRHPEPAVRAFRIVDGLITEEPLVVDGTGGR
ncbi:MAG: Mov34/MPN/PAD-1 family protein [Acidimicrobiales bacterium]